MSRSSARNQDVYLASVGASTPVGRDAFSSAAAVRAGISGFTEHPHMEDTDGEPMRVAMAPWLEADCEGLDRFEALLIPALKQALAPIAERADPDLRVALAVGLPSKRPGLAPNLWDDLRVRVAQQLPSRFAAEAAFPVGHAAGLVGLRAAWPRVASGEFDACVVAGVDSYMEPETLEWLEQNDQLHGAGPLNNAWGFIPGEGAGAVLLVTGTSLERLRLESLGRVLDVGRGFEESRITTETVCIGTGLTTAFRGALTGLPPGAKVTDAFCDLNGERYRADEFGFATLRTREYFEAASDFVAPADSWGDVSAASGPLGLMLSVIASRKSYALGPYALVWASSEGGERAAALLECPRVQRM